MNRNRFIVVRVNLFRAKEFPGAGIRLRGARRSRRAHAKFQGDAGRNRERRARRAVNGDAFQMFALSEPFDQRLQTLLLPALEQRLNIFL